jgi:hypothetical protein
VRLFRYVLDDSWGPGVDGCDIETLELPRVRAGNGGCNRSVEMMVG